MALESLVKHKVWIKDNLTPNLIENQKLVACKRPNQHVELRSIEIKAISLDVAFMLTSCYFVQISIKIKPEHIECKEGRFVEENNYHLVVKVTVIKTLKIRNIMNKIVRKNSDLHLHSSIDFMYLVGMQTQRSDSSKYHLKNANKLLNKHCVQIFNCYGIAHFVLLNGFLFLVATNRLIFLLILVDLCEFVKYSREKISTAFR